MLSLVEHEKGFITSCLACLLAQSDQRLMLLVFYVYLTNVCLFVYLKKNKIMQN